MERQTVNVMITVDLDPLPGAMHTGEDAAKRVEQILKDRFPHYNPRVTFVPEPDAAALDLVSRLMTPNRNFGRAPEVIKLVDADPYQVKKILIISSEDAVAFLETLHKLYLKNSKLYVSDLYDLTGITASIYDEMYGWTTMLGVYMALTPDGYLLTHPNPVQLA